VQQRWQGEARVVDGREAESYLCCWSELTLNTE
jgi:hypothetical protein